jgi:hypothetical protein
MLGKIAAAIAALIVVGTVGGVSGATLYNYYLQHTVLVPDPHGILRKIAHGKEFPMSYGPNRLTLKCADEKLTRISENALSIIDVFKECREDLAKKFSPFTAEDEDLFAIFVTIIASRLAPYGHSVETDWTKIPKESALNCAQHSLFVSHAIQHFYPQVETIRYGLDGGKIGNHAIVAYRRGDFEMVLDGMVSLIVFRSIETVLNGDLVNVYHMYDFYQSTDEHTEIARRNIRGALRMGAVRRKHVIYRQPDDQFFNADDLFPAAAPGP